MKLYVLKDLKSDFTPLFFKSNNAIALRDLKILLRDKNNNISQFPEDYQLFSAGEFDQVTAEFKPALEHVANCVDLIENE